MSKFINNKLILVILSIMLCMLSCCSDPDSTNSESDEFSMVIEVISSELQYVNGLRIENSKPFSYNNETKMTEDFLYKYSYLSAMEAYSGPLTYHFNADTIYTMVSLEENKIAYVTIVYLHNTGISYVAEDIIVYPFETSDNREQLSFLLEQDQPEKLHLTMESSS